MDDRRQGFRPGSTATALFEAPYEAGLTILVAMRSTTSSRDGRFEMIKQTACRDEPDADETSPT